MTEPHYFLAVPVSNMIQNIYQRNQSELMEAYSFKQWVHTEDLHITVAFLGGLSKEKVNQVREKTRLAMQKLNKVAPFSLNLSELKTFGSEQSPRILWVEIEGDLGALHEIQQKISNVCTGLELKTDKRPYRPHMTIAKKWMGDSRFSIYLNPFKNAKTEWRVDEVCLIEINPRVNPKYKIIERFQIGEE
jgi:RNA 2',3'-cyclic 3'-phosphodiesterase